MKLCLLTYNLARGWELPKLIQCARRYGFAALELRADAGHKHGVELDLAKEQRREVRDRVEDAYLEIACLGTGHRFESPDGRQRRAQVEATKRYVELAADVGCARVRVFGNDMPSDLARDEVVQYVGESLRELGEFADPFGVDVLLEMHGQFNYWGFARAAIDVADHSRVGIVYNCDDRDLVGSSVAATYDRMRDLIRHVHMHDFGGSYPYPELFELLQEDGYDGYLSSEIELREGPTAEQYLALYSALFRAWAGQPFHRIRD
ncbi:MAG TPA: sugar phosphate isomerase/epimerase family protein [Chloroflexota bacterium]|jgi:sugar phosphate isomerase/epimerase|nr:sugar phosphate isomerase/epimerase family protein [Chloroflexota bacterium]